MHPFLIIRGILIIIIIGMLLSLLYTNRICETFSSDVLTLQEDNHLKMRIVVINMDKDIARLTQLQKSFSRTDLSSKYALNRFPAVIGKNVNERDWLTDAAMKQLHDVETRGFRTHHYQLTRGAIGCFLSHYNLAKQLLEESDDIDMYFVLEDDAGLLPNCMDLIKKILLFAPENWDIILLYTARCNGPIINKFFTKCNQFWSTCAYILNKTGARKLVDEVDKMKMDGQIDAYLSRMVQQGKINVYGSNIHMAEPVAIDTNIQVDLQEFPGIDPFNYGGYIV